MPLIILGIICIALGIILYKANEKHAGLDFAGGGALMMVIIGYFLGLAGIVLIIIGAVLHEIEFTLEF